MLRQLETPTNTDPPKNFGNHCVIEYPAGSMPGSSTTAAYSVWKFYDPSYGKYQTLSQMEASDVFGYGTGASIGQPDALRLEANSSSRDLYWQ